MIQKKENKIKPPLSGTMPGFLFPVFNKYKISDNINLYTIEDRTKALINIRIMFHLGAYSEQIAGMSYFCSQLLTRGTSNRTSVQIAESVDSIGAGLSSSSSWDATSINITCMSDFTEKALEIIFDCFLNPVFSDDEINRYKIKHISEIEQKLSSPDYLASLAFSEALFYGTNFGHPILGTRESINSINREDCLKWYGECLLNSNISVIITGNINADYIIEYFQKKIKKATTRTSNIKKESKLKILNKTRVVAVDKKDSLQTVLRIGRLAPGRKDRDYPAAQVINAILGGFFLSRLNKILREKLGYTYGISSYIDNRKAASSLVIGTSVNLGAAKKSIKEILKQMQKISTSKVTLSELNTAKRYIAGSFVRSTETIQQLNSLLGTIALHSLNNDYFENYLDTISGLNTEIIFDVQKTCFSPDELAIAAVGSIDKLENILQEFGSLKVLKF